MILNESMLRTTQCQDSGRVDSVTLDSKNHSCEVGETAEANVRCGKVTGSRRAVTAVV